MALTCFTPRNLAEFRRRFTTDTACYDYLFALRKMLPFNCHKCAGKVWRPMKRKLKSTNGEKEFRVCIHCDTHESALRGTIFHATHITLKDWFQTIWWAAATDGLSVAAMDNDLGKELAIRPGSATTSYRIIDALRRVMASRERLGDAVDAGLTQIGVAGGKQTIVGIIVSVWKQEIRLACLPDCGITSLGLFFGSALQSGTQVFTNSWNGFAGLRELDFKHVIASHTLGSQVSAFTNSGQLEEAAARLQEWLTRIGWSIIDGRNLPGYLAEFSFRFACTRKGYGTGVRFSRLMRQALATPPLRGVGSAEEATEMQTT